MEINGKYLLYENDGSYIYGCDFGGYPLHKFTACNVIENIYPVYAESCGDDLWHCKCWRQRKNSDVFSIEYVQQGVFIFNHGDEKFECHPGDIFLLHYGSDSGMRCKTLTGRKKVIIMTGQALSGILNASGLERIFCIRPAERSKIDSLFEQITAPENAGNIRKNSLLCYELLLVLAESAVVSPRPPKLQKVLDHMARSLDKTLTLNDLSRYAGVSNAALNRLFHEYLQCAPVEYFRRLRMEKVRHLLKYFPVKTVAAMMDFSSTQYLATEFKKHFGVSPKHFRQQQ